MTTQELVGIMKRWSEGVLAIAKTPHAALDGHYRAILDAVPHVALSVAEAETLRRTIERELEIVRASHALQAALESSADHARRELEACAESGGRPPSELVRAVHEHIERMVQAAPEREPGR